MSDCTLSIKHFESQTKTLFSDLYMTQKYVDVTLVCNDGRYVPAHKFILSHHSSVLDTMLTTDPGAQVTGNQLIYLPSMRYSDLQYLLQFMYLGETLVSHDSVETLLKLAADLKINIAEPDNLSNETLLSDEDIITAFNETLPNMENTNELVFSQIEENPFEKTVESEVTNNISETKTLKHDNFMALADNKSKININQNKSLYTADDAFSKETNLNTTKEKYATRDQFLLTEDEKVPPKRVGFVRKYKLPEELDTTATECPKCEKTFQANLSLQVHFQAAHQNIRYPCDYDNCSYKATQKGSLQTHIRNIHTKIRLQCEFCNYECQTKFKLNKHLGRMHASSFPCTLCDFVAETAGNLKLHISEKHNGAKFPCDKCDYKASTPGHLSYHLKLHCKKCDKVVASERDMEKHKPVHKMRK